MSDLIDRQLVLDRINKQREHLRPYLYSHDEIVDSAYRLCAEFVEKLPSAEPEIIRCKDCKYAHLTYSGDCKFCDKWTDEFGIPEEVYLDGAFFCGYAKRREDE